MKYCIIFIIWFASVLCGWWSHLLLYVPRVAHAVSTPLMTSQQPHPGLELQKALASPIRAVVLTWGACEKKGGRGWGAETSKNIYFEKNKVCNYYFVITIGYAENNQTFSKDRMARRVLMVKVRGWRVRGRPRLGWMDGWCEGGLRQQRNNGEGCETMYERSERVVSPGKCVTEWVSLGHFCLALSSFEPPSLALVVITWRVKGCRYIMLLG